MCVQEFVVVTLCLGVCISNMPCIFRSSPELQQHDCKDVFAQVQVARSSLGLFCFLTLPKNGLMIFDDVTYMYMVWFCLASVATMSNLYCI